MRNIRQQLASLSLAAGLFAVIFTHASPAQAVGTQPSPPATVSVSNTSLYAPTQLTLRALNAASTELTVSWSPPRSNIFDLEITSYELQLNGVSIATFPLQDGSLPTTYTIPASILSAGGELTVVAYEGPAVPSPASPAVRVTADPSAVPVVTQPPTATAPAVATNGFGGSIEDPPYKDQNSPNSKEEYSLGSGIYQVYSEAGTLQWREDLLNGFTSFGLLLLNLISVGAYAIFGWSLVATVLGHYAQVVTQVGSSYESSPLAAYVKGACVCAVLVCGIVLLAKDQNRIRKLLSMAFLMLGLSMFISGNVSTILPAISEAPLTATQLAIAGMEKWPIPGSSPQSFNLSARPTTNGNALQQAVRSYINQSWVSNVYPVFCQVNFGNLTWATTTYVPNDPAVPGYNHLTFCEYYLKAETENNTVALSKLSSHQEALVFHKTGYIEAASPSEWTYFQGKNFSDAGLRLIYVVSGFWSCVLDIGLKLAIGLLVLYFRILITWDGLLLLLVSVLAMVPVIQDYLWDHLLGMLRRTLFPAVAMTVVMFVDRVSYVVIGSQAGFGWLINMYLRDAFTLSLTTYTMWKLIKWMKRQSAQRQAIRSERRAIDDRPEYEKLRPTSETYQLPVRQPALPAFNTRPYQLAPSIRPATSRPALTQASRPAAVLAPSSSTPALMRAGPIPKALTTGGASRQPTVHVITSLPQKAISASTPG